MTQFTVPDFGLNPAGQMTPDKLLLGGPGTDLTSMASWGSPGSQPAAGMASSSPWTWGSFLGNEQNSWSGWGVPALQAGSGLLQSYLGMKNYGLAKDMLSENRRQFDMNYGNQRTLTNAALEDRQRARVAANPGAYQSVGDYMNQNGVR